MANELNILISTVPANCKAIVMNSVGQFWYSTGAAFEAYNAAHIGDYGITLTRVGLTPIYLGDFPSAIGSGVYMAYAFATATTTLAVSDMNTGCVGEDSWFQWSGTARLATSTRAAPADIVSAGPINTSSGSVSTVDAFSSAAINSVWSVDLAFVPGLTTSAVQQLSNSYSILESASWGNAALLTAINSRMATFTPLTAAEIATGVWQDTTAGDFTVASSIGRSLYTGGNAPGAASGIALVGSNVGAATSVSGSVGSVTGNVGGNVVGSVGSVVGGVSGSVGSVSAGGIAATSIAAGAFNGKGDWNVGKTGYSLTPTTGLGNQTANITGNLSGSVGSVASFGTLVADIVSAVWLAASRTLTGFGFTVDTNANSTETAIKAKTDNLPSDPADQSLIVAATDAIMTRIGNAGENLTALGDARLDNLDATVSSRLATVAYVAPDNTSIAAIKGVTDQCRFTVPHQIDANAVTGGGAIDPADIRSAIGMASANLDTQLSGLQDQGADILDTVQDIASNAGTGARTVTVTVTDGASPVQGALVRLSATGFPSVTDATNASGVATLFVDDATYTVVVTAGMHRGESTSIVVNGNESLAVSLTPVTIAASNPGLVTGYMTALSMGVPIANASHTVKFIEPAAGTIGLSFDQDPVTVASDSDGLVVFTDLVPGARYEIKRFDGRSQEFVANVVDFQIRWVAGPTP